MPKKHKSQIKNKKLKKVLVTGASGLVGGHCVKELVERGYRVRASVRSLEDPDKYQYLRDLDPKIELVEGDLEIPEHWLEATKDVDAVLHVAAPVPRQQPKKEEELIEPTVNGVENVFSACLANKVKRIVMTSTIFSIISGHEKDKLEYTEDDFGNVDNLTFYHKAKTIAELKAWEFVKANPGQLNLTALCPGLILGVPVANIACASNDFLVRLMQGEFPSCPKMKFFLTSVREVALAHVNALSLPDTEGKRYAIFGESMWFKGFAGIIEEKYGPRGYKLPTSEMWYTTFYMVGWLDYMTKSMRNEWDKDIQLSNARSVEELDLKYEDPASYIHDTVDWLLENGYIKLSKKDKAEAEAEEKIEEG